MSAMKYPVRGSCFLIHSVQCGSADVPVLKLSYFNKEQQDLKLCKHIWTLQRYLEVCNRRAVEPEYMYEC